ncbi:MAG: hypothetical protein JTT12_05675 [Candidatus Brockarchaeota archaeon]|nr:hypothetical protein [Candidatus Brockarchaeota archaeon]
MENEEENDEEIDELISESLGPATIPDEFSPSNEVKKKIEEALRKKGQIRYDKEVGLVTPELSKDEAKSFMPEFLASLWDSYDSGTFVDFDADAILSRVTFEQEELQKEIKEKIGNIIVTTYSNETFVSKYFYYSTPFDNKFFKLERDKAIFENGEEIKVKIDEESEKLVGKTLLFCYVHALSEGYWIDLCHHDFKDKQKEYIKKYHIAPDDRGNKDTVSVWVQVPHVTRSKKLCRGEVRFVAPYHFKCYVCGTELRLWEWGISYDVG